MAPPPEHDKEPKAPDKSASSINGEDPKTINNTPSEQFPVSDSKSANNVPNTDAENKHVETLDDGQLRALLDEAITYKCPKDREGKSSLFKELLEEVEQDEQACEAAARELTGSRGRRAGRGRRALPHSNSLQDLVAALAAESAPRRTRAVPVSTRAIHGGSLPSGVDTSFLLSEEPPRAGYLATVRCVNPPPLCERASTDDDNRRSKPTSGVTYTARATLEIGGGRAVTTTTASNQVRTSHNPTTTHTAYVTLDHGGGIDRQPRGPRNHAPNPLMQAIEKTLKREQINPLLEALNRNAHVSDSSDEDKVNAKDGSGKKSKVVETRSWRNSNRKIQKQKKQRHSDIGKGRIKSSIEKKTLQSNELNDLQNPIMDTKISDRNSRSEEQSTSSDGRNKGDHKPKSSKYILQEPNTARPNLNIKLNMDPWHSNVNAWYEELKHNSLLQNAFSAMNRPINKNANKGNVEPIKNWKQPNMDPSVDLNNTVAGTSVCKYENVSFPLKRSDFDMQSSSRARQYEEDETLKMYLKVNNMISDIKSNVDHVDIEEAIKYRKRVGKNLKAPSLANINPKNVKSMTIGSPRPGPSSFNPLYDTFKLLYKNSKTKDIDNEISLYKNTQKPIDAVEKSEDLYKTLRSTSDECDFVVDMRRVTCDNSEFLNCENDSQSLNDNIPKLVNVSNECDIEQLGATQGGEDTEVQNKVNSAATHYKGAKESEGIELIEIKSKKYENLIKSNKISEIELKDMSSQNGVVYKKHSISDYYADQERFLKIIESNNNSDIKVPASNLDDEDNEGVYDHGNIRDNKYDIVQESIKKAGIVFRINDIADSKPIHDIKPEAEQETFDNQSRDSKPNDNIHNKTDDLQANSNTEIAWPSTSETEKPNEQYILAELSNNAYIFLTLPQCLLTERTDPTAVSANPTETPKSKKKSPQESKQGSQNRVINKTVLQELLFENLFKSISEKSKPSSSAIKEVEVDSAIPFTCITTPEVVTSCNTTASTQSATTVDPKPLQLGSCYRAVASLTGPGDSAPQNTSDESNVSPSANGLPLSRTSSDDYKKSLDENGNSVSPVGSGILGKKRGQRRRTSRNETVIKSHHIDGYQGNKDLNELLRFIEASVPTRPRRKPQPDVTTDKKKRRKARSAVRARAASLDTLTPPAPPEPPPPAPEPESTAGFTTVSRRRRSRRKNSPPPPEPEPEPSEPSEPAPPVRTNQVPDLIESHRAAPPPSKPRPDVLCRRRAVQLPRAPPPPPGLTFGFDLNHTLLPPSPPRSPPPQPQTPATPPHLALINYVSDTWHEVISRGKVRYYTE